MMNDIDISEERHHAILDAPVLMQARIDPVVIEVYAFTVDPSRKCSSCKWHGPCRLLKVDFLYAEYRWPARIIMCYECYGRFVNRLAAECAQEVDWVDAQRAKATDRRGKLLDGSDIDES